MTMFISGLTALDKHCPIVFHRASISVAMIPSVDVKCYSTTIFNVALMCHPVRKSVLPSKCCPISNSQCCPKCCPILMNKYAIVTRNTFNLHLMQCYHVHQWLHCALMQSNHVHR